MELAINSSDEVTERLRKQLLTLPYDQLQQLLFHAPTRPPAQAVTITVRRDKRGTPTELVIKGDGGQLTPQAQIVWTCPDGKLEIRFSPAATPFRGAAFETPRAGRIYSGTPSPQPRGYSYRVLVTTPDGFLLDQAATLSVIRPKPAATKKSRRP